jgi:hypothetical protein
MRIFRGLDTAFSGIHETESENTFADQLGDGLVLRWFEEKASRFSAGMNPTNPV